MHYDALTFFPFLSPLGFFALPLIVAAVAWTLVIKGFALWKSARKGNRVWFVVLLILNTLGILDLVYLIWFATKDTESAAVSATPLS